MNDVVFEGCGSGLFFRPGCAVYLGHRDPRRWTEFNHDRNLLGSVCDGGMCVPRAFGSLNAMMFGHV